MGKPIFSEKAQTVLTFLQDNDQADFVSNDIAAATGIEPRSMTGVLNGLQRKGLLVREAAEVDGKAVKFIRLTEEGKAADPDAEKSE